jgi:hypothetical protein
MERTTSRAPNGLASRAFDVLTKYQRLSEFTTDVRHLLDGEFDEASIGGESLA